MAASEASPATSMVSRELGIGSFTHRGTNSAMFEGEVVRGLYVPRQSAGVGHERRMEVDGDRVVDSEASLSRVMEKSCFIEVLRKGDHVRAISGSKSVGNVPDLIAPTAQQI